jgi:ABC-2 type transport system permease protein
MNRQRIKALIYRHLMLLRHDLGKVLDTFYWPLIDIFSWGFLTVYISENQVAVNNLAGILLSAIILWTLVYTVARDVTISFLDDMWDRNVVNLYCSPLKPIEFLAASLIMAVFRVILTTIVLILVAFFFYSFNILILGFYLILFFLILVIFSYSMGIFATALIMRFGPGVEVFAWSIPAVLAPISGIFYPLSILPPSIQKIAHLFPTSYIFEGMRGILTNGVFNWQNLFSAALLDLGYLILAFVIFYKIFNDVKKNGLIARFS